MTVAYRGGHYATLVLNRHTPTPMVTVYDGLIRTQKDAWKQWKYHIKYLVQRVMGESNIGYKNVHLAAEIGGIQMIQEDGYNCGPITCVVVWCLFNMAEAKHIFSTQNFTSLDDESIRKMVVVEMLNKLTKFQTDIVANTRYVSWNEDLPTPINNNASVFCTLCAEDIGPTHFLI